MAKYTVELKNGYFYVLKNGEQVNRYREEQEAVSEASALQFVDNYEQEETIYNEFG
jgi:hypothetical protein